MHRRGAGRRATTAFAFLACFFFLSVFLFFSMHEGPPIFRVTADGGDALMNATLFALGKLDALATKVEALQKAQEERLLSSPGGLTLEGFTAVRRGHRGAAKLCSFTEGELDDILRLGHSCKRKEKHYFYNGGWMDWQWLSRELFFASSEFPISCVLVCTNQPPCDHIPCLTALHLRRNSTDLLTVKQSLEEGEYDVFKPHFKIRSILDAGANIGIAASILATTFPKARIVCVEASQEDYDILRLNTANYPNVVAVNAALWPKVTSLAVVVGDRNPNFPPEWGYVVMESSKVPEGSEVKASLLGVSVHFLMRFLGVPYFDFVKIDIEGIEKEVFTRTKTNKVDWLKGSKLIAVRVHPDMRPHSEEAVVNSFSELPRWSKDPDLSRDFQVFRNDNIDLSESQSYSEQVMNQAIGENSKAMH